MYTYYTSSTILGSIVGQSCVKHGVFKIGFTGLLRLLRDHRTYKLLAKTEIMNFIGIQKVLRHFVEYWGSISWYV